MEDFQGAREDDGVEDMEVLAPSWLCPAEALAPAVSHMPLPSTAPRPPSHTPPPCLSSPSHPSLSSPLLHRGRPGSSLLEPSIRSAWWKTTLPVFGEQTQDGWRRVEDGGERMNKGWRRNCTAGRRRSGGSGARGGARWRWGLVEVRLHPKPAGWRDIAQSAEAFGSGWWRRS